MEQSQRLSLRSSRGWLILVFVVFLGVTVGLVYLFASGRIPLRYGLGPEVTMEFIIVSLGILLMFLFLSSLPLLMVIGYQGAQQKTLIAKTREDLWLCGLDSKQLQTRMNEFESRNSWGAFLLPAIVNLAFLFVMWGVVVMPGGMSELSVSIRQGRALGNGYNAPNLQAFFAYMADHASLVTWAFLGAYVYSLMVLIRRWLQSDLTTGVLWKLNVRVAVALILGLLLMRILPDVPVFVAFVGGIVPDTVLSWLSQQVKRLVNLEGEGLSRLFQPSDLQDRIDGLNFWQADRLFEEGIESVQDLAMKEIPSLLIATRFDTAHLLYWVDQALLCNQVGEQATLLKCAFIYTASDLLELENQRGLERVWESIRDAQTVFRADGKPVSTPGDAEQPNARITLPMLENVVGALQSGPNLGYVREYWKNTRTPQDQAERLKDLERAQG